jgi:PAS domain S-box-containing protein
MSDRPRQPAPAAEPCATADIAAALRESEQRFRTTFELAAIGIAHVALDGRWLHVNQKLCEIVGYSEAELRGRTFQQITHPDDLAADLEQVQRLLANELHTYTLEKRYIRKDASLIWINLTVSLVRGDDGQAQYFISMVEDITERKRAAQSLQVSEERFRTSVENMLDSFGIYAAVRDPAGRIVDFRIEYVNQAACESNQMTREQQLGHGLLEILPAHRDSGLFEQYCQVVETGRPLIYEATSYSDVYAGQRLSRAFDLKVAKFGDGITASWRDVTERQHAEAERYQLLRAEQSARAAAERATARLERLQSLSAALASALTPDQVADVMLTQGIAELNAQAGTVAIRSDDRSALEVVRAVGYPAELIADWVRIPLDSETPLAEAVRSGAAILLETRSANIERYTVLDGMRRIFEDGAVVAFPLRAGDEVIGGLGLSFAARQEFSPESREFMQSLAQQCAQALERARLYQAEQRARAAAQDALRARDGFLSLAAHELRNPLTTLLGNAELLQRRLQRAGGLPDRDARSLNLIAEEARRLNKLIAELLDISRLEQGQLRLERAPLDLGALVRRAHELIRPTLTQHTLRLECTPEPLPILGDELRLAQVLQNLISNAIKYSPAGGPIDLRGDRRGSCGAGVVSDRGIGIPAEALPQIFHRFYRADHGAQQSIGGLGIGLYVVKEIITIHGGDVTVASAEGQGSSFTVTLPLSE